MDWRFMPEHSLPRFVPGRQGQPIPDHSGYKYKKILQKARSPKRRSPKL
jgi:hypothetical protein